MNLIIEHFKWNLKAYILSVHNGQYYGNNLWANPGGKVNDGKFNILELGDISFLELLKVIEELKTGNHLNLDKVKLKESIEYLEVTSTDKGKNLKHFRFKFNFEKMCLLKRMVN